MRRGVVTGRERLACEVFGVDDPSRKGIFSIGASDGGGLTRITSVTGGDDIPGDYSPDGESLVFFRDSNEGKAGILVTELDGDETELSVQTSHAVRPSPRLATTLGRRGGPASDATQQVGRAGGRRGSVATAVSTETQATSRRHGDLDALGFVTKFAKELPEYPDSATKDLLMADWQAEWNMARILAVGRRADSVPIADVKLPAYLSGRQHEFEFDEALQ